MADILCEVLHIVNPKQFLLRSDNPKVAIATGLAILPALQHEFEKKQNELRKEKPVFLNEKVKPFIYDRINEIALRISEEVAVELYDKKIREILTDFRENGGRISTVKERIASAIREFEPELREIAERHTSILEKGILASIVQLVSEWFEKHGLHYSSRPVNARVGLKWNGINIDEFDLYDKMTFAITAFISGVVTAIVASICGGGGMALIMSGPIGWIIGAVIAVVGVFVGRRAARRRVEKANLPKRIVRLMLTERRLNRLLLEGREKLEDTIKREVQGKFEQSFGELMGKIEEGIEKEINSLSVIDQL